MFQYLCCKDEFKKKHTKTTELALPEASQMISLLKPLDRVACKIDYHDVSHPATKTKALPAGCKPLSSQGGARRPRAMVSFRSHRCFPLFEDTH